MKSLILILALTLPASALAGDLTPVQKHVQKGPTQKPDAVQKGEAEHCHCRRCCWKARRVARLKARAERIAHCCR